MRAGLDGRIPFHTAENFCTLFLRMIPPQLCIAKETLESFQPRMNALVPNSRGEKRLQVEYLKSKEYQMPTNLRLCVHKANVALDYLQDNPAPVAVVDLPILVSRPETINATQASCALRRRPAHPMTNHVSDKAIRPES